MKIKRFNEAYYYENEEYNKPKNISEKDYEYIRNFANNIDNNIIEWISEISKSTKLKEFANLTKSEKDALIFSESKNFKKLKKLLEINKHIIEIDKEYKKIIKNRDILFTEASNEILYTFQEELINKDFDKFFELFIEDSYINYIDGNADNDYIYYDIHPKIMIKYGEELINHVNTLIDSEKYNL